MKVRRCLLFVLFILLFPFCVLALDGGTGRVEVNQKVDAFSVGNINVSNVSFTNYHNYDNTGVGGYTITSTIHNYYTTEVEISYRIELYNINGETMDIKDGTTTIGADDIFNLNLGEALYPNVKGFSINDVKTYSISIVLLSDVSVVTDVSGNNTNYYLDRVNIVMNIDKSNVVEIDEALHFNFKKPIKYVERKLFVNNKVDGYVNQIARLEKISTSEKTDIKLKNGYEELTMGNSDGSRYSDMDDINIKYTRVIGEDVEKDKDVFYMYIVDPTLDVVKKNISFEIVFPELTGKEKIKFVNGKEEIDVNYEIIGNKIVGNIEKLESKDSLAILVDLKDGYFIDGEGKYDLSLQLMMFGPTVLLFVAILITFLFIKKKKVHENLKVSEVLSISPLRVGYIKKGTILVKDIATLIFELAIGGFIKIVKVDDSFELKKVKNYTGQGGTKSMLFEDLFKNSKTVSEEDIYNNSYDSIKAIKKYLKNDEKNIENNYINKYTYLLAFAVLSLLILVYRATVVFDEVGVLFGTIISLVCFILLIVILYSNYNKLEKSLAVLCVFIFLGLGTYFFVLPAVLNHYVYTISFVIGIVDICILLFIYKNLPKRSLYADRKLAKILRFDELLRHNSMKQIEKVLKNEELYFRLLPYVYALDMSDEWTRKASSEGIPSWLVSDIIGSREAMKYLKDVYVRLSFALSNNSKK